MVETRAGVCLCNLFRKILNSFYNSISLLTFMARLSAIIMKTQKAGLRLSIIVALLFMMVGTAFELILLEHYEDWQQLIPLVCIGAAMLLVGVLFRTRSRFAIVSFKTVLGLTALSGIYGTYLHLQANYEFELEMRPTAAGWELFTESLAGALPALAPGSMIVLAIIGYSFLTLITKP